MSVLPKAIPESLQKRMIVFCGSGGVGKTTISAAVSLGLALRGKKVLVMTIDPARRLMDSLGIRPQDRQSTHVADLSMFPERVPGGELHACMLETKRHMDEVVHKLSPDEETYRRIMENRIYQVIADNFSGSQETIALVKLQEFTSEDFDHIVVDTAPHRYAVEFFETPHRLTDFLDPKVYKWLSMPLDTLQSLGNKFFKRGTDFVFAQVEKAIGLTFVNDIMQLLGLFEGLTGGFRERSEKMRATLKDASQTSFNIVAAPTPFSSSDAVYLREKVHELAFPPGVVIFNRIHEVPRLEGLDQHSRFASVESGAEPLQRLMRRLVDGYRRCASIAEREREVISEFRDRFQCELIQVPFLSTDVAELRNLSIVNSFVFGARDPG